MPHFDYTMPDDQGSRLHGAITVRDRLGRQVGRMVAHNPAWTTQCVGHDANGSPLHEQVKVRPVTCGQIEVPDGTDLHALFWDQKGREPIFVVTGD